MAPLANKFVSPSLFASLSPSAGCSQRSTDTSPFNENFGVTGSGASAPTNANSGRNFGAGGELPANFSDEDEGPSVGNRSDSSSDERSRHIFSKESIQRLCRVKIARHARLCAACTCGATDFSDTPLMNQAWNPPRTNRTCNIR